MIADFLVARAVRVIQGGIDQKRALDLISEIAAADYGLDKSAVLETLEAREALGSTGVGNGVALPHGRLESASETRGVFLRLERPIDFGALDRKPVDLIFALFSPVISNVEHLKALAQVARTLRNPAICEKLRANSDAVTLHAILTEGEAIRAA
ncbi:MAG: PTS sugar transporter subunit IIA [Pseudomonadota bacterium]